MVFVWLNMEDMTHSNAIILSMLNSTFNKCNVTSTTAQKHPKMTHAMFFHDIAQPHIAKFTHENILDLDWKVQPHLLNSPGHALTDYHLFWALQNIFNGKTFAADNELKTVVGDFFNSKPAEFYKSINDLLYHWKQKIKTQKGDYCLISLLIKVVHELSFQLNMDIR